MASTNPEHTASPLPKWDGMPITANIFLRDIGEHAARHGFWTLLLQGHFVSRSMIICASSDVVAQVRAHHLDSLDQ